MTLTIGVVMDPIAKITAYKDSTFAMLLEAQSRQYRIFYMEPQQLFISEGKSYSQGQWLTVEDNNEHWFNLQPEPSAVALGSLDVILMRQDPPFNMNYIYATYILEQAERDGALVANNPGSVRDCNEKLFATQFPQCGPVTTVSANKHLLKLFIETHKDTIFKPLDGMGGQSIFRLTYPDANSSVIIDTLTDGGKTPVMAQKFIPEISEGDKRILLIDGEPVPFALARIPQVGETRGNLAAGGKGEGRPLTDRDRWICEQVGPTLKEKGLIFVGIDVIGDYLTEINVTSPTCIRELDQQFDLNISSLLWDCLESKIKE